jgi:DNA-binding NtrC family response regulator
MMFIQKLLTQLKLLQNIREVLDRKVAPASHLNGKRVLFLDDQGELVELAIRLLKRRNYHSEGFSQPTEALEAFRKDPEQFSRVVTDLNMPVLSALDVTRQMLAIRPEVPLLLCDGEISEELKQAARTNQFSSLSGSNPASEDRR